MITMLMTFLNSRVPYWRFIAVGAAILACFVLGWHWRGVVADNEKLVSLRVQAEKEAEIRKKYENIASGFEKKMAEIRAKNIITERKLRNEIEANSVYRSCIVPDGGVQLLRDAARTANSTRQP